jgi:nucleotide-binding universal stress UspA family protein
MMVKRILIGLGGTPFASVAIERAIELAQKHGARLKAVTVVDPGQICKLGPVPPGAGIYARKMCENRVEVTRTQIEASIVLLQERCAQSAVDLSIQVETGDPFDLMIAHARYHDLSIFGLRSLFEYRLANAPEKDLLKLLSKGARPIIAVSDKFRKINKVMIAYSGSMESANAMQHFVQLMLWPDARLDIIHIGNDQKTDSSLIDDAAAYCTDHGYTAAAHWRAGKTTEQLLDAARQIDADMIVMGRSVRSMLMNRIVGDTVLNTLTHSNLPLFLSH